jgi:hypothetical protein
MHFNLNKVLPLLGAAVIISLAYMQQLEAFLQRQHTRPTFGIPTSRIDVRRSSSKVLRFVSISTEDGALTAKVGPSVLPDDESLNEDGPSQQQHFSPTVVRCPLRYLGPYPAISLRFPHLATRAQRGRNATGVSLDFVVDTAANLNTLNGQVATELQLEQVGEALPGVAASGPMAGGHTYMLGDTELERGQLVGMPTVSTNSTGGKEEPFDDESGLPTEFLTVDDKFLFMENLTASVMPVSSPGSAGLLSLAFMYCFEGGVEFQWGKSPSPVMGVNQVQNDNNMPMKDGLVTKNEVPSVNEASVTFYGSKDDDLAEKALEGMTRVLIKPIPTTQLPSIIVKINNVEIPALLDTGSPITVLNHQAAVQAGIKTIDLQSQSQDAKSSNPLAAIANKFKEAQAISRAAANGDVLMIASTNGPVNLLKSLAPVEITVMGDHGPGGDDNGVVPPTAPTTVSFGKNHVFVGEIPGLHALNGIGVDAPPAVVFGMDFLRQRPKMLLRAQQSEVYF